MFFYEKKKRVENSLKYCIKNHLHNICILGKKKNVRVNSDIRKFV